MFTDNTGPSGFFMQPTSGGFEAQTNVYGGQQRRQNQDHSKKSKVFMPVTLRMVAHSQPRPDDVCEFEGNPINDIIIVGRLLRRTQESMRTIFEINDNTNTFTVLFYHKGENQVPTALRNFNFEQFTYAKIYGNIRVFKEEKAIVGTHIKRIDKFDEVTNHFLSVFIADSIRKKGILKPRELAMDQNQISALTEATGNGMIIDQMGSSAQGGGGYRQGYGGSISDLRKVILNMMKELNKTTKFVNKLDIYAMLQDKIDQQTYDRELEKLANNGDIVQGFDSNHFYVI